MDGIDLLWAVLIGVVVGLGAWWPRRRGGPHPYAWVAIGLAFAAAVLGALLAGVVGVADRSGFEPVERLLQFVFAVATMVLFGKYTAGGRKA